MKFIVTKAGYAALVNAANDGTNATQVVSVALGDGTAPLTADTAALTNEHHRLDTIAGQAVDDNIIHVTVRDESDAAYTVTEFALILADGTLLGVYSQADPIIEKAAASVLLESLDILFADVDVSSVTFDSLVFSNPPASETVLGVAEIATTAETAAGTDDSRIITPRKLKGVLPVAATTEKAGLAERATVAEAEVGSDDLRFTTPSKVFKALSQWFGKATPGGAYPISISGIAATANNADKLGGKTPDRYAPAGGDRDVFWKVQTAIGDDNAVNNGRLDNALSTERDTSDTRYAPAADYRDAAQLTGQLPTTVMDGERTLNSTWTFPAINAYASVGHQNFVRNWPTGISYRYLNDKNGWPTKLGSVLTVLTPYNNNGFQLIVSSVGGFGENRQTAWLRFTDNTNDYFIGEKELAFKDDIQAGGTSESRVKQLINEQRDRDWPVGSMYFNTSNGRDPGAFLPGNWQKVDEGFLLSQNGYSGAAGATGGERTVLLALDQMPTHHHDYDRPASGGFNGSGGRGGNLDGGVSTTSAGGGEAHNNMPPYVVVYMWKRVS